MWQDLSTFSSSTGKVEIPKSIGRTAGREGGTRTMREHTGEAGRGGWGLAGARGGRRGGGDIRRGAGSGRMRAGDWARRNGCCSGEGLPGGMGPGRRRREQGRGDEGQAGATTRLRPWGGQRRGATKQGETEATLGATGGQAGWTRGRRAHDGVLPDAAGGHARTVDTTCFILVGSPIGFEVC